LATFRHLLAIPLAKSAVKVKAGHCQQQGQQQQQQTQQEHHRCQQQTCNNRPATTGMPATAGPPATHEIWDFHKNLFFKAKKCDIANF
jgi:hypothetical protein